MENNFDSDAVDDIICDEVLTLYADCSTCSCCKSCCSSRDSESEDSHEIDQLCNFEVDFYVISGLECGGWWEVCYEPESYYDPLPVD